MESNHQVGDLPSWVPDWSAYDIASSLNQRNLHGDYKFHFDASNIIHDAKVVRIEGDTLELEGHRFDQIISTGFVMDPHLRQDKVGNLIATTGEVAVHLLAAMMNWFIVSGALSSKAYPTGEDIFDVVVRTIFLDYFEY